MNYFSFGPGLEEMNMTPALLENEHELYIFFWPIEDNEHDTSCLGVPSRATLVSPSLRAHPPRRLESGESEKMGRLDPASHCPGNQKQTRGETSQNTGEPQKYTGTPPKKQWGTSKKHGGNLKQPGATPSLLFGQNFFSFFPRLV